MRLLALLVEQLCLLSLEPDVTDLVTLTKDFALDKPYSRSAETEADEVGLDVNGSLRLQSTSRTWFMAKNG